MNAIDRRESPAEGFDRPTTAGRRTSEEWVQFFSAFSHIVLVANSDANEISTLRTTYPDTALFVFFNKVDKVLSEPFHGNTLLITRSNQAGSELVYRNILDRMVSLLPCPGFTGVMNVRADSVEAMNSIEDFGNVPAGLLDLASYFEQFYPLDHNCSTGFAMAVWICEHVPGPKLVLSGFTAQRSKWKLFHIHDWTFEQTFLRLLALKGRLEMVGTSVRNSYALLADHFPYLSKDDVAFGVAETLSLRLESTNRSVDKLISITMPLRVIYNGIMGLKRKSKKERILAARRKLAEKQ
ncbi:3-deoxy-manno-octulosonate cytidylyltransferase [Sinorhizobium sp. BG8]|uniref:3-deoxy-manno-octulosonate cytidylyltransferase n=1 Tax=Sinorhizobium sp. BG8 TaxID=2613773 RepID=UPI00193D55D0|nr:3-deoxy-manno-octulosonate cytidylyltransferase [Sinorhizobium sp. BG8]QRM56241.1 3-deoxy-manno-octulosonate cytidylyltransferase [Sinorhizobium sp. BG8]